MLGERYRIVGLLGRGGMGEVYRADDLKLEQPVALKFLPRALEGDADRLERLYGEVRMARQVSHPAVCRVWDIGEAEGQHFLSMEFVDGENLASLLRRIGRLPPDKALDIARQVCAGLAAAHEKGVLHRDLKPANVMLDGQGKVRLTDFGLAGLAEALAATTCAPGPRPTCHPSSCRGARSRSAATSTRSASCSTSSSRAAAFEGKGSRSSRASTATSGRSTLAIVPDLDPAVERTILACLEKDPKRRPPSALAVSAMLSGRDPLEAAIAAGETPSPELVAAAGEAEGLRPRAALACLPCSSWAPCSCPRCRRGATSSPGSRRRGARRRSRTAPATSCPGSRQARRWPTGMGLLSDYDFILWTQERDHSAERWDARHGRSPGRVLLVPAEPAAPPGPVRR